MEFGIGIVNDRLQFVGGGILDAPDDGTACKRGVRDAAPYAQAFCVFYCNERSIIAKIPLRIVPLNKQALVEAVAGLGHGDIVIVGYHNVIHQPDLHRA